MEFNKEEKQAGERLAVVSQLCCRLQKARPPPHLESLCEASGAC